METFHLVAELARTRLAYLAEYTQAIEDDYRKELVAVRDRLAILKPVWTTFYPDIRHVPGSSLYIYWRVSTKTRTTARTKIGGQVYKASRLRMSADAKREPYPLKVFLAEQRVPREIALLAHQYEQAFQKVRHEISYITHIAGTKTRQEYNV